MPSPPLSLVDASYLYAAEAHRGDLRKGTSIPYLSHLLSVAALVWEYGGDGGQVAAAFLHDVAEDHGGAERLANVRSRFGDRVADIVGACSDSLVDTTSGAAKAPWIERKSAYLFHIEAMADDAVLVTAADKLHNARSLLADHRRIGDALWSRFSADQAHQLWYLRAVGAALGRRPPAVVIVAELQRVLDDLTNSAVATTPDLEARIAVVAAAIPRQGRQSLP